MTCIVGLRAKGRVWMGGDSAGVSGDDITIRSDPKVFIRGPLIIGFTSSFRMGQILRFEPVPNWIPGSDPFEWMVRVFIPSLHLLFDAHGFGKKEGDWGRVGGQFLVGLEGRLFEVAADFQVGESADEYDACGCGAQVALGAMYQSRFMTELDPDQRITLALRASERYSAGVRGPFTILSR